MLEPTLPSLAVEKITLVKGSRVVKTRADVDTIGVFDVLEGASDDGVGVGVDPGVDSRGVSEGVCEGWLSEDDC